MKTLQHFFYPGILSLVFLISMAAIEGCNKNNGESNNTTTSVLLDSVISDNGSWPYLSIKYIYDSQERVTEERVSHNDTLKTRRTYEYQSSSMLPYKMNSYKGTSTAPEFVSDFLYNSNGQKIYDSTYAMPAYGYNGSVSVRLDYSVAGRITVKQRQYPSNIYWGDTLYLNNGNIDSAYVPNNFTWRFTSFSNQLNVFKNLSISSCRFFSPAPTYPGHLFTGLFYSTVQDIPLEYFNTNDYANNASTWWFWGGTSPQSATQYEYQYNSSNLPVSLKKTTTTPGYLSVSQTRFVYK